MVTIYLAPRKLSRRKPAGPRSQAARHDVAIGVKQPTRGRGRTPIVPLFGLAPGGVWPSLCHHRRPDALTVRFHPYRQTIIPAAVCFCATFRPLGQRLSRLRSLGVTQHPVRRSPDFPPRRGRPRRGGHPVLPGLSNFNLAYAYRAVNKGDMSPRSIAL